MNAVKATILVAGAAMTLTACSSGDNSNEPATPNENVVDNSGTAPAQEGPLSRYSKPVTITTAKVSDPNPHFPAGKTSKDNVVVDWIRDKLNIQTKIVWETDGGDYNNKLSVNLASNDLPDMIFVSGGDYSTTFKSLVENDMLADLTDAYNKYAGDYIKSTQKSYDNRNLKPLTFDGKLYGFTSGALGYSHDILWLRKDWLDKVGMKPPKTLEDVEAVAKAFVDKDPGGNGKGKTIGLAVNAKTPVGGYGNWYGTEPILASVGAFPRQWMKDGNGKVYYSSTTPEMKNGLGILRDMYKEGLIDRSFLTRINPGETDALVNSNAVGMYFGPWYTIFGKADMLKEHPEAEWIPVNAPLDAEDKYKHMEPSPTGNIIAINKKYDHPEALFKMLNLEYDMSRGFNEEGFKALKPYLDAGTNWTQMQPTGDINVEYYDAVPIAGKLVKSYIDNGDLMENDKQITNDNRNMAKTAKRWVDNKDVNDAAAWGEYHARYLASTILDTPENVSVPSAYYFSTDSFGDYKPSLDKLEDEMYLQIIVGEKPLDYFDDFVKEWRKIGGDLLTREVQEAVDNQD